MTLIIMIRTMMVVVKTFTLPFISDLTGKKAVDPNTSARSLLFFIIIHGHDTSKNNTQITLNHNNNDDDKEEDKGKV